MKNKKLRMKSNRKAVIVLPTYNERENIAKILDAILNQKQRALGYELSILVVDDSSPDGTAAIVKDYAKRHPNIHLLTGKKQGLGAAYIRGFKYAIRKMQADVVFEMDADFSHNPIDIPRFLTELHAGNEFVIGSRYVAGGSIPKDWSLLRKLNSKWGNIFAKHIAGIKRVKDCTSGYRAIKTSLLKKINLDQLNVKGYAFQLNLLHQAMKKQGVVTEIPITFTDRVYGQSKIRLRDITEFIGSAFMLRFPFLRYVKHVLFASIFVLFVFAMLHFYFTHELREVVIAIIAVLSVGMTVQAAFTLWWMLYAWDYPEQVEKNKSPEIYRKPELSFTAIVPARHEEKVIGQTITALSNIDYPETLKEVIAVCRFDDTNTITEVRHTIARLGKSNIRLVIFEDLPINKPHSLNVGLQQATKDVVVVFDAEDEPHKDIFNIANTVMKQENADVLQSGVQLMNYRSTWFSTLNVLEYFFWFKSTLQFFASVGIIPLGGNTVFFKKDWLERIDGWDESCLTEDADIGMRLSAEGARIRIVYDEKHVTQEESPLHLSGFVKQRTRWSQGFMQIFAKGEWLSLPKLTQRFLAGYILISPELQALMFLYVPVSLLLALYMKLPVWVALLSSMPCYLLVLQMITYNIGLYLFTKDYNLRYSPLLPLKIFITYLPFQFILGLSASRAIIRTARHNNAWEKTLHVNAHRVPSIQLAV